MVEVKIRAVRPDDVEVLLANMRQPDIDEVTASCGDVRKALVEGVESSDLIAAAEFDGELACIFGCAPIRGFLGTQGAPWMLGTDKLDRHPSALMRHCRPYIEAMQQRYPHLLNFVDARNTRSIRWLKRMGFTFHPAVPYGVAQLPFHMFERRARHV